MQTYPTIKQRIADFRAFCETEGITFAEVARHADINQSSLASQLQSQSISAKRMGKLEESAIELAKKVIK